MWRDGAERKSSTSLNLIKALLENVFLRCLNRIYYWTRYAIVYKILKGEIISSEQELVQSEPKLSGLSSHTF